MWVRLVGTFSINDATDPFWDQDLQLTTGLRENAQYRTFGPFFTTVDELLSTNGVDAVRLQWRTYPDFDRLVVDDAARLRARVEALEGRLSVAAGEAVQVTTGLAELLREFGAIAPREPDQRAAGDGPAGDPRGLRDRPHRDAARRPPAHRHGDAPVARRRRRPDRAARAARGAAPRHPAVLVAPWIAVGVLELFNVAGPLADVGLHIDPRVSQDAYLGAAAAGIVCVALLVLPAALSARRFAAAHGDISRQETRTFGQRMGLDVALLAVTGIALWQLRLYGAPLTRTVQGSLGLDPLLVAAPAIALIAGGVLALRLLPLLAQVVERTVSRGRSLVASLGSRQLARRPLRYTRSALLLMLAMSMGVFALSYATTWASSQR